ncbi:kinase-like protein, partial [Aureobasidium melanogenum]
MLLNTESIPFYAPRDILPSRLPSQDEIARASEVFSKRVGCAVVGVGRHYVVKYGCQVDLNEGETMLHVARFTTVRVPQVFALFRDEEHEKNYIIMERICGETLERLWPSLSQVEKEQISAHLKASVDELRRLPSPGVFCALERRPLPDVLFRESQVFGDDPGSTFDSEEQLNSSLLKGYASSMPSLRGKAEFYRRSWPLVFHGHSPVFTHGDIRKQNIMVSKNDREWRVLILDWKCAGWYPTYWEYTRALFACGRFDDDWDLWLHEVLEPFPDEYSWMYTFMLELWS